METAKYLGVTIHRSLNWKAHIQNITKKANSTRAFLQRNLHNCPRSTKALCYQTLVRPLLEYASVVWDPATKDSINRLEAVQRGAARLVFNNYSTYTRVTPMIQILNWPPSSNRKESSLQGINHDVQDSTWPGCHTYHYHVYPASNINCKRTLHRTHI